MPTLFYSPAIRVLVEVQRNTGEYQTIDVSDDIATSSISLRENASHGVGFQLINHRRKYDNLFTPNDRIVVQLRRVNWLQSFAGYLSQVPIFSAYQRSVSVTAECTLKRLRFYPFDPGSDAWAQLIQRLNSPVTDADTGKTPGVDSQGNVFEGEKDGGMSMRIKAILKEVVGWDEEAVHIGAIPELWVSNLETLYKTVMPQFDEVLEHFGPVTIGSGGTNAGDPNAAPSGTQTNGSTPTVPIGPPTPPTTPTTPATGATPATANVRFQRGPDPSGQGSLAPQVSAAIDFIKANWIGKSGVKFNSVYRGGGGPHGGSAIDVGAPGLPDNPAARSVINGMIQWFMNNPGAFGIKQIIWQGKATEGNGWHGLAGGAEQWGGAQNDWQHTSHVHLGFGSGGQPEQTSLGPMGGAWPGTTPAEIDPQHPEAVGVDGVAIPGSSSGGTSGATADASGNVFLNSFPWYATPDPISAALTGPRALLNDAPEILPEIANFCRTGMRSYCSAPNGDFIAWFPDYFGLYGTAGRVQIELIELMDFTMAWDDERLKTHEFVVGSRIGLGAEGLDAEMNANRTITHGIATVEFPEILEALMGVTPDDPIWGTAERIFKRFGARPETQPYSNTNVFSNEINEFWAAIWYFQRSLAEQFSADIPITFMPELFPGMILEVPALKFQAYVTQVNHNIDFSPGAGFTTTASVIAPSTTDGQGWHGLVKGKTDPNLRSKLDANPLGTVIHKNLGTAEKPVQASMTDDEAAHRFAAGGGFGT